MISQIDLKELLDKIIELHFDNYKFTHKGSLEWYPIHEKQKERYFKKFGKELKNQRRRYKIKEVYWEGNNEGDKGVYGSSHHHIVISYYYVHKKKYYKILTFLEKYTIYCTNS